MKIAVLSDIHGNSRAFETCIQAAQAQGIDHFILLGDYIGDLPYPQKTMDLLYDLLENNRCWAIKGNKEDYYLNYAQNPAKNWQYGNSATGTLLYNFEGLRQKDLDFFQSLPPAMALEFENLPGITICHGSPTNVNEHLWPNDSKTAQILRQDSNDLLIGGHIHLQFEQTQGEKLFLNPGSIGLPLKSQTKAQFLILEGQEGSWKHEFISLDYDLEAALNDLQESGLYQYAPYWTRLTAQVLRRGIALHSSTLNRAMELCQEAEGSCSWPDIPETYWQKAFAEIEL